VAIIKAAKVESLIVKNIIEVDDTKLVFGDVEGGNGVAIPPGYVEAPSGTRIGDTDNEDGTFTSPSTTLPALSGSELTNYQLKICSSIDRLEKVYRTTIFKGEIDGFRAYEYIVSLLEMATVLTNSNYPQISGADKELLTNKAGKRSTTETAEATVVSNTYVEFRAIIGDTAGIRTKHKDSVNAATDRAGCDAGIAAYVAEIDTYILALP